MKNLYASFFMAVLILQSCSSVEVLVLSDEPVSENFVGNGVEWSAYPHADSDDAEWGYLMTDAKLQRVFDRLDDFQPLLVLLDSL